VNPSVVRRQQARGQFQNVSDVGLLSCGAPCTASVPKCVRRGIRMVRGNACRCIVRRVDAACVAAVQSCTVPGRTRFSLPGLS